MQKGVYPGGIHPTHPRKVREYGWGTQALHKNPRLHKKVGILHKKCWGGKTRVASEVPNPPQNLDLRTSKAFYEGKIMKLKILAWVAKLLRITFKVDGLPYGFDHKDQGHFSLPESNTT